MSELMVLGFENEADADQFGVKLQQLQKDMIVELQDAAMVVRDADGKPHVKHGHNLAGALMGKMGKTNINQAVLEQMGDAVPPGKAGWFLLVAKITEDKFLEAVEGTHAKVVRTNLSHEDEEKRKEAFGADKHQKD